MRLAAPKKHRVLPAVLAAATSSALLDVAAVASDDDEPVAVRDAAVLEVALRHGHPGGELTGLDIDDVDLASNVVRVIGKG